MKQATADPNSLAAFNYCVSFIDLLGQRAALRGQSLLPPFTTQAERDQLNAVLRGSIGAIIKLQSQAEDLLRRILTPNRNSPLQAKLPPEQHATWDEMQRTRVTTQRWSDGLVSFVSLGDRDIKCRMNGVFGIFSLAGALCFIGLATCRPVRGAIEVAWGVELHQGELYGAAVARAYELESEVAQYPRIVIGSQVLKLLEAHAANQESDSFSQFDRELAKLCLGMLIQDADGHWILHYLGEEYQRAVTQAQHAELYESAREFVMQQLAEHHASNNSKLAFRYTHLLHYFDVHAIPK